MLNRVYAEWCGQTALEESRQSASWFDPKAGKTGHLLELHEIVPSATKHLCQEAFLKGQASIPASVLRERLPETLELVERRARALYNCDDTLIAELHQSFSDFVALCEAKERETGEPVRLVTRR